MKLQLLVSAMNLTDIESFICKMNIKTEAIIINQTDKFDYCKIGKVQVYSFKEKGVGLSRNSALMRATGNILLLTDDDMHYVNEYKNIVINEFRKNPTADMIIFNIKSLNANEKLIEIKKGQKLGHFNYLKYGGARIAFKLNSARKHNINFSLLFGGGCQYGSGEDSIFIHDFIKHGLNVYTSEKIIGFVDQNSSTWFSGYNKKYFYDKGALYYFLYNKLSIFVILRFAIIFKYNHKKTNLSFKTIIYEMRKGAKEYYGKSC